MLDYDSDKDMWIVIILISSIVIPHNVKQKHNVNEEWSV